MSQFAFVYRRQLEKFDRPYSHYTGPKFQASYKMRQEGILGNWALDTLTPNDLENATDNLIKNATEQYDKVGCLKPEELTVENCIQVIIATFTYVVAIREFYSPLVRNFEIIYGIFIIF